MPDIVDWDIVMLAPKEGRSRKRLAAAKHVTRRRLALPFCEHPMLDANVLAGVRVGPARDVAGGEDSGRAGLKVGIHRDTAIDLQASLLGQLGARPHADADDDQVGFDSIA